jgi:hypothetical protein
MTRLGNMALVIGMIGVPGFVVAPAALAQVDVSLSIGVAPPPLLVYEQPPAPAPGYLWTPGYWAWSPAGYYYWVPGTWVLPPQVGLLWTPGWWGWSDGYYRWHGGYWAPQVGYYGGINYGFGYFGAGYSGGRWRDHQFYYNTAVNRVNVTNIHNTYVDRTVIVNHNVTVNRVSYNGGRGGVMAQPTAAQRTFDRERHVAPTSMQARHVQTAMDDPAQRFQRDRTLPVVAATPRAASFAGAGLERPQRQPRGSQMNPAAPAAQATPRPPAQPRGLEGTPQRGPQGMPRQMPQAPQQTGQDRAQRPPQVSAPPRFEQRRPVQPEQNAVRMNDQARSAEMAQQRARAAAQTQARERAAQARRAPEARRAPPQKRPERGRDQERQ